MFDLKALTWKDLLCYVGVFVFIKWVQPKLMPKLDGAPDARGKVRRKVKLVERTDIGDNVEPVESSFKWQDTESKQYRPFASTRHLNLSISRTSRQEWLVIDENYVKSIEGHKQEQEAHPDTTCAADKTSKTTKAVQELYDYVLDTLVKRYPLYFVATGDIVANLITDLELPRKAAASKLGSKQLLQLLSENLEEDILLLDASTSNKEKYVIKAATNLRSSDGTSNKIGKTLGETSDSELPEDDKFAHPARRYFSRVFTGQFVQCLSWSVSSSFKASLDSKWENSFVQVDRQVMCKLKNSQYLVVTSKPYSYAVSQVKAEGHGSLIAETLEAWPEAYVSKMGFDSHKPELLSYLRQ